MGHDLPQEGDDYSNKSGWLSNIDDSCDEVDEPPRCLSLSVSFSVVENGKRRSISDPGPDYESADPLKYTNCDVTRVHPSTDPPTTVPSGTRITVDVLCEPAEVTITETTTEPAPEPPATTETESESGEDGQGG